jgi:hypothetical protein
MYSYTNIKMENYEHKRSAWQRDEATRRKNFETLE